MALKLGVSRLCRFGCGREMVHGETEHGFSESACVECYRAGRMPPGPPDTPRWHRWGHAYIVESDGSRTFGFRRAGDAGAEREEEEKP